MKDKCKNKADKELDIKMKEPWQRALYKERLQKLQLKGSLNDQNRQFKCHYGTLEYALSTAMAEKAEELNVSA
ncbi:MAG: hypothetical protein LBT59_05360 [Clostridiales bacterium]|jgi:hypothetical protein|nr:hypothetical protein [Clostridiales bacterium]